MELRKWSVIAKARFMRYAYHCKVCFDSRLHSLLSVKLKHENIERIAHYGAIADGA